MSDSKVPEVSTAAPEVIVNRDAAAQTRQKAANSKVARGDVVHLRDDPEAKAAFLATFTAEDEKRIMRKVDMRFVFLAGVMYLIKQVSNNRYLGWSWGSQSIDRPKQRNQCQRLARRPTLQYYG